MGIVGILLGLVAMMYIAYKGYSVFFAAPLCALIVALANGMPLLKSYAGAYMAGTAGFFQAFFPIFLLGAIIGKIYADSGAGISVAEGIMKLFAKENSSENRKQIVAISVIVATGGTLGYGGINVMVLIFTLYPLALSIIKEADIPKRFLPAIILCGLATFAMIGPGSPQIQNLIPAKILGTSPSSGLIPGIIGIIFIIISSIWYLNWAINKAKKNGEYFMYGPNDSAANKIINKPSFIMAAIPLAVVFGIFNVLKQDVLVALFAGIILSLLLFYKYIGTGSLNDLKNSLNAGALASASAVINVSAMVGFGSVVKAAPAFGDVVAGMVGLGGNPLLMASLAVAVIAGITGSASGGLGIAIPLIAPTFVNQLGVDPAALHRVAAFASSSLDTLPSNGALIMLFAYCGLTHKESYGPAGIVTVLITGLATLLVLGILTIFPGLA